MDFLTHNERILLCATRFWVGAGGSIPLTTSTLRSGVRHVARKQGVSPQALDKAERSLVREGLLRKPRRGEIALTELGVKMSRGTCERLKLPPWDWEASYKGRVDGRRRRR